MSELSRGVLVGPFLSLGDVPYPEPCVAPRHGIWEMHGCATELTVRVIDDLLAGEQNSTGGAPFACRPADVDALVALVRAVA